MRGTRLVLLATIVVVAFAGLAISQAPDRRDPGPPDRQGPPPDGPGGPQFHVLPPFAQRELQLTLRAAKADRGARGRDPGQDAEDPHARAAQNLERTPRTARTPRRSTATAIRPVPINPAATSRRAGRIRRDASRGTNRAGRAGVVLTRGPSAWFRRGPRNRDPGDGTPRRNGPGRRDGERRDGANRDDQSSSGRRSRGPLERITQQLELTADQQSKVDKLLEAHHEKTRALFRQVQADLVAQMKEVLTEEQFKQFTKALEAGPPGFRRPDRNDNPDRPGGADRPDSAATQPTADAKK